MTQAADGRRADIRLIPLSEHRLREWLPASVDEYAESVRSTGRSEDSIRSAIESVLTLFTDGTPPDDLLWSIRAEREHVGVLWLAPGEPADASEWWINDLMILAPYRRHGYGHAALRLAMHEAASRGAERLGLSVFADNAAARRLYRAAGFRETQIDMSFQLPHASVSISEMDLPGSTA